MRKNKIILFVFIGISIVLTSYFFSLQSEIKGSFNPNNIEFTISTKQAKYLRGERIWIIARIVNNSNQNFYVKQSFVLGDGLKFLVKNSNGKTISQQTFDFMNVPPPDSIIFMQHDTLESVQNLDWYNLESKNPIDEFSIVATYNNFTSNEIQIKVLNPEGSEQHIYEFINKYDRERILKNENGKYLDEEAISLIKQYPMSPYVPILYEQILGIMLGFYPENFQKYFDEYLQSNINDPNLEIMINLYAGKLKLTSRDKTYLKSNLQELKTKYGSNMFLNDEINRYIKRNIDNDKYWFKK